MRTPDWQSDDGRIQLHNCDCLELLPQLEAGSVDAIVTDPPYPSYYTELFRYNPKAIEVLSLFGCRQFVFWTPSVSFPLSYSGKRIWDKAVGINTQFEEIYERNNGSGYKIHRHYSMGCFSSVGAKMTRETITGHPSQKPVLLIEALVKECEGETICDPFTGSGTTAIACIRTNRSFIGCEIDQGYFATAVERIERELARTTLIESAM